jgi:hypothetical protein
VVRTTLVNSLHNNRFATSQAFNLIRLHTFHHLQSKNQHPTYHTYKHKSNRQHHTISHDEPQSYAPTAEVYLHKNCHNLNTHHILQRSNKHRRMELARSQPRVGCQKGKVQYELLEQDLGCRASGSGTRPGPGPGRAAVRPTKRIVNLKSCIVGKRLIDY